MFQDIMKDSWVYQEIVQESEERGLAKGLQAQRRVIVNIVRNRFPELEELASRHVAYMNDLDALSLLTVSVASAPDVDALRKLLNDSIKS